MTNPLNKQRIYILYDLLNKIPAAMRITLLLLCVFAFQLQAEHSYSQNTKISLDMKNSSIEKILQTIEEKSEFYFLYNSKLIDVDRKTDIQAKEESIASVLNRLFDAENVEYEVKGTQIILHPKEMNRVASELIANIQQQQRRQITGQVTDERGEPVIGANIIEKGTTNGTVTDIDGNFSFRVEEDAILHISYIGYLEQEIPTAGRTSVNIILHEDTRALEEVVVVGYGTQRKETLAGSVSSINSSELTSTKTDNVVTNMQGKIPGLLIRQNTGEPGTFDNLVSIRGFGSPVVVIDGIVRTRNGLSDLAQVNSEDIESISILKDASAAIYGMNASNGVIIVTTKKGESGKARFSYSGMYGVKMPTGMPEMVDAYTYRLMANEYNRNIGKGPDYDATLLEKYKNGEPGYQDWDWIDMYLYDAVPVQNHTITVRGGSEKVNYFVSLGYNEDNGLLTSDVQWYKRYTLRSNLQAELTKDFKMNVMVSGREDNRQRGNEDFIWTYKSLIVNDRGIGPYTLNNPSHLSRIGPEDKNPAALVSPDLDGYRRNNNFSGSASVDFTYTAPFLPGLSVNLLGSYDISTQNESHKNGASDIYDYYTDTYAATRGQDSYWNRMQLYNKVYTKLQGNYTKKFGSHSLGLMGAVEASEERYDNLRGQRSYNDVFTFDVLDMGTSTTATNSGNREFRRYAAYIGRANYDYQGKYIAEVMIRYDGSYRYAPSKRWVLFPSFSAAWRVSEEKFFKDLFPAIDNLKFRASYGESGRDQGDAYSYMPAYTSSNSRGYMFEDGSLTVGMYPPGVVNDRMSWVTAKFYNLAVDMDVKRISATFEFFQRKNTGLLASKVASVTNTFGASFPQENINSDMNTGLELQLKYRGNAGKDFKYVIGTNVTYARTKRLHVESAPYTSQWDNWRNNNNDRYQGRNLIYTYDGQYTSLYDFETVPLLGGARGNSVMLPGAYRIKDNNGDGRINADDQVFENWAYGNQGYVSGDGTGQRVNPPLQYGFTFDFVYKEWDLNLLFQGAALYSVNYHMNDIWGYGRYPTLHEKFLDRWHTANPDDNPLDPNTVWIAGKYPAGRPYNYNNTTDALAINVWRPMATYLRLKNVELGYTVSKTLLSKIGFEKARLYVNGTNLLLFCNDEVRRSDPERHENEWEAGLSYPIMKAVNFGINLTF